jgi:hypothetical protein
MPGPARRSLNFVEATSLRSLLPARQIRALAVTTRQRHPPLPEIPTHLLIALVCARAIAAGRYSDPERVSP